MMGLTDTPAELWFSWQKKKKSPSVNSNQFSIVAKLSRSAVYLKMYLTSSSSSPPPTLWTFSMVFTEAQPQVFSTFSRCPVSLPRDSFGNNQARQPASCFYLLAFSNVSFCHRSGLCALRVSYRVSSWYAGVTSLMWERNGCECLVSQKATLRSSTKVSCVLLSSTFCCQFKPFLILWWWLCNLSDSIVCMWVERWLLWYTPHLIQWNGLTNQGSCWRNVAASHASVIVNVSETCFFFVVVFHSWRSVRCGRVTLKLAEGMNCFESDVLCEVKCGC